MNRYYVRKDKLKKIENAFRADLRWLKKNKIRFNMGEGVRLTDDLKKWTLNFNKSCGTCLVGAHVLKTQCGVLCCASGYESDAAAKDLGVATEWMDALFLSCDKISVLKQRVEFKDSPYPQALELALRLRQYAAKIGLGSG